MIEVIVFCIVTPILFLVNPPKSEVKKDETKIERTFENGEAKIN